MHSIWRFLPDLEATEALGKALAPLIHPGALVALNGELGSGKTSLVRAMLKQWGHLDRVKSPSYTLLEHYEFPNFIVCHFDFYRFNEAMEADQAGFREHFNAHTICLIEWPDRAKHWLPEPDITITWSPVSEGRLVSLQAQKGLLLPADLPGTPWEEGLSA